DGKAIWRASITSDTGWSHSFTFLKLAPALIWESGERPAALAGSVRVEQGATSESATLAKTGETIADEDVADVPSSVSAVSPPLTTATAASGMDGIDALLGLLEASQMRISPQAAPPSARELQAEDSRADTAPP